MTGASRLAFLDNVKVAMIVAVIVGHTLVAWSGFGSWYLYEPKLPEPLLTVAVLVLLVGALCAMPILFLVAGRLTPASWARKGTRRFVGDRVVRLGVPLLAFAWLASPLLEWVDPENHAARARGFARFTSDLLWPLVPGPAWFLEVLLVLSIGYALARSAVSARLPGSLALRHRHLVVAATMVAVGSTLVRLWVPLGEERAHLALGQAPAWVVLFVLGVLGAERGWWESVPVALVRVWALLAVAGALTAVTLGLVFGADSPELIAGGPHWPAALLALSEGLVAVGASVAVIELFKHRFAGQRRLGRMMAPAAYGAFLVHPLVLVGLILLARQVEMWTELRFAVVAALAVVGSFVIASLLRRVPGVRRVI
ncbi:MAG: acyltransferase [Actinomycetes bacterium]